MKKISSFIFKGQIFVNLSKEMSVSKLLNFSNDEKLVYRYSRNFVYLYSFFLFLFWLVLWRCIIIICLCRDDVIRIIFALKRKCPVYSMILFSIDIDICSDTKNSSSIARLFYLKYFCIQASVLFFLCFLYYYYDFYVDVQILFFNVFLITAFAFFLLFKVILYSLSNRKQYQYQTRMLFLISLFFSLFIIYKLFSSIV
jgi:hypothetical protein